MEKSPIDFDLLRSVVPGWKEAKDSEIEAENLSVCDAERVGLYSVTYKGGPSSVTYRKFMSEDCFKKYRYPAENGIGPKTIYSKYPILIQEFIEGAKVPGFAGILTPKIYSSLFKELVKLQKITIPEEFSKTALLDPYLTNVSNDEFATPFEAFDLRCKGAQNLSSLSEEEKTIFAKIHPIIKEREFILEIMKPLKMHWCHGDLHDGNMLWYPETNKVTLIDYEDSGVCFRGYDLANLLYESCWEIIDEYPKCRKIGIEYTEKDLERMLLIYTLHWIEPEWEKNIEKTGMKIEDISRDSIKELILEERQREVFFASFDEVRKEFVIGTMCTAYFWIIWNALQFSKFETDDWGHLQVSNVKFDLYFETKKQFLDIYGSTK